MNEKRIQLTAENRSHYCHYTHFKFIFPVLDNEKMIGKQPKKKVLFFFFHLKYKCPIRVKKNELLHWAPYSINSYSVIENSNQAIPATKQAHKKIL